MTDFAKLILTADASGLKQGEAALDSIAAKGEQTEKRVTDAMDKTGKSADGAGDKLVELGKDATTAAVPLNNLGDKVLPSVGAGAQKVITPLKVIPGGLKDTTSAASRLAPAVQNASYQIGDFAVQVASGGNAATAFAQQMPQLLGSFGMFGALAGAAVAVGAALWPVFFDSADGAKELDEAIKDLNERIEDYEALAKMANASSKDLGEKFGSLAGAARELYEGLAKIAHIEAIRAISAATGDLDKQFKQLRFDLQDIAEAQAQGASTAEMVAYLTGQITDEYGLTVEQAQHFVALLDQMKSGGTLQEQASATEQVALFLQDAVINSENFTDETLNAAKAASDIALSVMDIASNTDDAGNAVVTVSSQTYDWADAMASVRVEVAGIASVLAGIGGGMIMNAKINAAQAARDAGASAVDARRAGELAGRRQEIMNGRNTVGSQYFGLSDAEMQIHLDQVDTDFAQQDEWNRLTTETRGARGGGSRGRGRSGRAGGGRGRSSPQEKWGDDVAEYQRQTEAFLAQADALAKVTAAGGDWERALAVIEEEQQLLNAAQKAGIELTPEIRAGIKGMAEDYIDAEEKLEQMRSATERGQDAMRDLFGSMIDGAGSTKEALASLLAEIAKVQFAKGAMGLLGQTSWGSGLIQGIGNLLSFDGGGYTGDGARSGGLDGKGGFLAMMHPNETVTDHTKGQGGATSVHVTVGMDESGNLQVRKIAQQEAASMGQAVSASIPGRIQQYSANPRRR